MSQPVEQAVGFWESWFGEPLRKVEADALAYRLSDNGKRTDWKTPIALLTAALCLTVQNYISHPTSQIEKTRFVARTLADSDSAARVETKLRKWSSDQLASRVWWAGVAVFTYAVIPLAVVKLVFREPLRDYGLKLRGVFNLWPLYILFIAIMVPLVYFCSAEERFQQTYPFLRCATREQVLAEMWKWELAYAAQFVALEFFFRGFILHGTKHRFGVYSVFVMTLPYVMIHFGKPMPEAVASIIAGVVLGFMSLATRSIWLGAALHITVAWGMDFSCLARTGLL